jgi:hypothetical protein
VDLLEWKPTEAVVSKYGLLLTAIPNVVYSQQKTEQTKKPNIVFIMVKFQQRYVKSHTVLYKAR